MMPIRPSSALAGAILLLLAVAAVPAMADPAGASLAPTPDAAADVPSTVAPGANVQSRQQEQWRSDVARSPDDAEGCATVQYPSKTWVQVPCVDVPAVPFRNVPKNGAPSSDVVGNGNDWAAISHGLVYEAFGYFPHIRGLKRETDNGVANIYSLQLNTETFGTGACRGTSNPKTCRGWAQFLYSSGEHSAFIQYWLLNYGANCPTKPYNDWIQSGGSCFRDSKHVGVALLPITKLPYMEVIGAANSKRDHVLFFVGNSAYRAGANDDVVYASKHWVFSEFNVFGDAGGSQANFNAGTSILVRIRQQDGTSLAPGCRANKGFTGETTNLTLGLCKGRYGSAPYIQFHESN